MKEFLNIGPDNDQRNLNGQIGDKEINEVTETIEKLKNNNESSEYNNTDNDLSIIEEGFIISSRYKIQKLLGRGGMADVYLALDLTDNKKVALKQYVIEFILPSGPFGICIAPINTQM